MSLSPFLSPAQTPHPHLLPQGEKEMKGGHLNAICKSPVIIQILILLIIYRGFWLKCVIILRAVPEILSHKGGNMTRQAKLVSVWIVSGLLFAIATNKLSAGTAAEAPAKVSTEAKKSTAERIVGQVLSMDIVNKGLVLASKSRGNVGINISDSAKIMFNKKQIAISEIKTGDKVSVYVKRNAEGGLTAKKIIIWKSSRNNKLANVK